MSTAAAPSSTTTHKGNDALLIGIVLSVSTFWLFAQTASINGPLMINDLGINAELFNAGVSAAGVACGIIIAVAGTIADRNGHVRFVIIGNIINIIGSILVGAAMGGAASVMLMVGRVLQGFAAGFIMPATLSMIRFFWEGKERQRAISMWSLGSFGSSSLAAAFGGLLATTPLGWRGVFFLGAIVSVIGILLVRRAPETETPRSGLKGLDWPGIALFTVAVAILFIVITQASMFNWGGLTPWLLIALVIAVAAVLIPVERKKDAPFVDFKLFGNRQFSGAVFANLLINTAAGGLVISGWTLQFGYGLSSGTAGAVTIGFAIAIFLTLRIGEKLIAIVGVRTPMLIGAGLVCLAMLIGMGTFLEKTPYLITVAIASVFLGLGLAIFATPTTDAALSALPPHQAGVGSGFYKMASALGNGFGIAVAVAVFNSQREGGAFGEFFGNIFTFAEVGDVAARQAGLAAMTVSFMLGLLAVILIAVLVPRKAKSSLDAS